MLENLAAALGKGKLPRLLENILTFKWPFHSVKGKKKLHLSSELSSFAILTLEVRAVKVECEACCGSTAECSARGNRLASLLPKKTQDDANCWFLWSVSPFPPSTAHPWLWPNTDARFSWQYTGRSILWEGWGPGFATNSCVALSKLLHPVASVFLSIKWGWRTRLFLRPLAAPVLCGVCICAQEWRKEKAELVLMMWFFQSSQVSHFQRKPKCWKWTTKMTRGWGGRLHSYSAPEFRNETQTWHAQAGSGNVDRVWFPDLVEKYWTKDTPFSLCCYLRVFACRQ